MKNRYTATLAGNDIGATPTHYVGETLEDAKRNAEALLGDGFQHHSIVIRDTELSENDQVVAVKKLSDDEWPED